MLELVGDFFGRKECVGAGISGGGPPWAHEAGGEPSTLVARWMPPCYVLRVFLYCTDNQITDRKIFIFILFNINNRK